MDHDAKIIPWRWLSGMFVIALMLRVAAVLIFDVRAIVSANESGMIAHNLVEGRGYTFDLYGARQEQPLQSFLPPLFPWLMAFCLLYFAQPELALGLIQSILSGLTVVLLYFVALRLSGEPVTALLTVVGAAFYPVPVLMSAFPVSLTLSIFLLVLFLVLVTSEPATMRYLAAAAAGIVLGLMTLVRPMSIGFLPLTLVGWVLQSPQALAKIGKLALILGSFALLTLLPWMVRNYQVHGRFVFVSTNGGYNFWAGNNPFTTGSGLEVDTQRLAQYLDTASDPNAPAVVEMLQYPFPPAVQAQLATSDEVALDRQLYQAGWRFIHEQPARWRELALAKLKGFWWFRDNIGAHYAATWTHYYKLLYAGLLALAILGFLRSLRHWRRYSILYLLFAYYTLVYVTFHVQTRYRWEIEPILLIFAAIPVCTLWNAVMRRPRLAARYG